MLIKIHHVIDVVRYIEEENYPEGDDDTALQMSEEIIEEAITGILFDENDGETAEINFILSEVEDNED